MQPTLRALDVLASAFSWLALGGPERDLVPLFPLLGWTPERVAALNVGPTIVLEGDRPDEHGRHPLSTAAQDVKLAIDVARAGAPGGAAPPLSALVVRHDPSAQGSAPAPAASWGRVGLERVCPHDRIARSRGALGGTFDHLHAGHRLLLAAGALTATDEIFVGITDAKLLLNKRGKSSVASYDSRRDAAVAYLASVAPDLHVTTGTLGDPLVQPAASTDPGILVLVVSEETVPGGEAIEKYRIEVGNPAIELLVVPVLDNGTGGKLSSTDLRG